MVLAHLQVPCRIRRVEKIAGMYGADSCMARQSAIKTSAGGDQEAGWPRLRWANFTARVRHIFFARGYSNGGAGVGGGRLEKGIKVPFTALAN